ncbi:MAG: Fur family transcriptional regulator [Oscillospiraceae bacterium]
MPESRTYATHQHKAILACIEQRRQGCFTAAELAETLRQSGEKVGLATIYRQLEKLEKTGVVQRIDTDEGACWQCCEQADHDCFLLKCERCGRITHVDCAQLGPLYRHVRQEHHFAVNPRRTMLYGLCGDCREERHA